MNSGGLEAQGQLNHRGLWSGRWESNPHPKFGNLLSLLVGRLRSCGQGVGEGVAKRQAKMAVSVHCSPPQPFRDIRPESRIPAFFRATGGGIFVASQLPTSRLLACNHFPVARDRGVVERMLPSQVRAAIFTVGLPRPRCTEDTGSGC